MGALEKLRETAQKIRESVYGIEVREDIADGFENVVDAQNEYEAATTVKLETKLNEDFGRFSEELATGVNQYVDERVEERIVEVMDDLSDDNLRSEIQQARNSAAYAVNYGSVDARLEADEVKLKDVVSEVNAARNSTANGKTYASLDSRLEESETNIKQIYTKSDVDLLFNTKVDNNIDILFTGNIAPANDTAWDATLSKSAADYKYLLVTVATTATWTANKFFTTGIIFPSRTFGIDNYQDIRGITSIRLLSGDKTLRVHRFNGGAAFQLVRVVGVK